MTNWRDRVRLLLREITIGGLAGLIAGVLVAGVGSRIFMRLAALIDPGAAGRMTSNGNVVGEITLAGTLALVVFEGLLAGVFVAVEWVVVSPWLPPRGPARHGFAAALAIVTGAAFVVRRDERDFALLHPAPLVVAMLIALIGLLGVAASVMDGWLRPRLDGPGLPSRRSTAAHAAFVGVGVLLSFAVLNAYFDAGFATPQPATGVLLLVVGLATVGRWVSGLRRRPSQPSVGPGGPRVLRLTATAGLAGLLLVGGARLWSEVAGIVEAAAR